MAKEMMIVFVYDTGCCVDEEDDPADAVLYFHPGWVSDTQRLALAGQVVGAAHCIKSLFSQPLAITLQSGKFIIREYGRYILAIGSDRNIPDWVLKNRASLLTSMIKVYHGDLQALADSMEDPNPKRLAEKLYQIFETYLPVLQYGCHIFQRVPMLSLPKSATSVYMESMQILEHCRRSKGVLGGVILYNNKIISTQLPPSLTSYLTVVDPYRIKSPAENLETETPLPLGAQLLVVYVGKKTYNTLKKQTDKLQDFFQNGEEVITRFKKLQEADRERARDHPQSGMKRDKSLLFTAVPEEDHTMISPPNREENPSVQRKPSMPDVVPFTNKPRPRPNKLSLSFKTQKSVDEDVKENDKVFTGQTSVCSTPMVEYKRLHGNMLSICQNPDKPDFIADERENAEPDVLKNIENTTNGVKDEKRDNKTVLDSNCIGEHFINKPEPLRKLASVTDLQETFRKLSTRASSKMKLQRSKIDDESVPSPQEKSQNTMTINDPLFPVFRNDGVAISESLFNQYLEQYYSGIKQRTKEENMFNFNLKLCELDKFKDFDSDLIKSPQRTPKKVAKDSTKTLQSDQSRRKSLSLPLKSLSESSETQIGTDSDAISLKKKLSGVQLTPLMEKLSHLAFSDKSSGYSSRVMTPLELRELLTPALDKQVTFSESITKQVRNEESEDSETDNDSDLAVLPTFSSEAVKCALFVSGLHNMALLALLDLEAANDADTINSLWETSLNALGPIEQKCMEPLTTQTDASDYSYLVLDPDWGTVKKGGPWAALDIATMGFIHNEFEEQPDLTEFILRSEDSVVLGTACGGAQIYYQESGARQAGPPPPSDILATAPLRARRRLHRDHSALLL